jgi:hypothetical protein
MQSTWTCAAEWPGETVWIVGGGPSVRTVDLERLKGRKVIAINSSFRIVPFADFLLFGDSRWFFHNWGDVKRFKGRIVSCAPSVREPRCLIMRKLPPPPGITEERDALAMKYTSYQAAMNLAVHLGAARIVCLGLDGKPGKDGKTHHHDGHPWPQRSNCWDMQYESLQTVVKPLNRAGIDVVNANPDSAYKWWRKESVEECLERYA